MLIGFLVAVLSLVSLSPAHAQDTPRHGGELIALIPSEPPSYDGHAEGTFGVIHPLAPHYSTLLRIDPFDRTGTRIAPDVAESWSISKDGLTYFQSVGVSDRNFGRYKDPVLDDLFLKQAQATEPEERKKHLRAFEKRLLDEEVHYMYTLQWHRIVPHSSKVRGWTITPAHFLNNQLDTVWLAE